MSVGNSSKFSINYWTIIRASASYSTPEGYKFRSYLKVNKLLTYYSELRGSVKKCTSNESLFEI